LAETAGLSVTLIMNTLENHMIL